MYFFFFPLSPFQILLLCFWSFCLFVCLIVLAVDVGSTLEVCCCRRRRCQVFVVVVAKCLSSSSSSGVDLSFVSHLLLRFFGCAAPESSLLDIQLLWVCSSCSQSEILKHKDRERERVLGLQLANIKSSFCFFHLV